MKENNHFLIIIIKNYNSNLKSINKRNNKNLNILIKIDYHNIFSYIKNNSFRLYNIYINKSFNYKILDNIKFPFYQSYIIFIENIYIYNLTYSLTLYILIFNPQIIIKKNIFFNNDF